MGNGNRLIATGVHNGVAPTGQAGIWYAGRNAAVDCIVFGRSAGVNAAKEKPWT